MHKIINGDSLVPLILTCEHASSYVPEELEHLGLSPDILDSSVAYDIGVIEVATAIAIRMKCPLILCGISRLVIDCNRPASDANELIPPERQGVVVPGNQQVTKEERQRRIEKYYQPYKSLILKTIVSFIERGQSPIVMPIHSFATLRPDGSQYVWDVSVQYGHDTQLKNVLLSEFRSVDQFTNVGDNEPYDLKKLYTGTVIEQGHHLGLSAAELEFGDTYFIGEKRSQKEEMISNFAGVIGRAFERLKG